MWCRVLKEARPVREERVIPLRVLKLVPPPQATAPAELGEAAAEPTLAEDQTAVARAQVAAVREEAAAILARARQEAEEIKARTLAEREEVLAEGRAAGQEQGYQEGLARAEEEAAAIRREADTLRQEARQVLAEAQRNYQETITAVEGAIIDLAQTIAARIIGREIELRPDLILEIARPAIRQVAEGQHYTIYAAPDAAEVIREHRQELLAEAAPGARLQVVADPGFKAGGCRIETENGFIDASVDTQLAEVKQILRADHKAAQELPSAEERLYREGERP
ncbi:FliH/SctL family protein [Moorella naiadis]|uniref:FliH/SctL family protein n=1 Tax=Moorella naiadis (nom. illeg.) TaxID=3093670 RepID=UPI003D9CA2DD